MKSRKPTLGKFATCNSLCRWIGKRHLNHLLKDEDMGFNNNLDNHQNVNPKDKQHGSNNKESNQ